MMCEQREAENELRGVYEDDDTICRHVVNSQEFKEALARRGQVREDHEEFTAYMFGRDDDPASATPATATPAAAPAAATASARVAGAAVGVGLQIVVHGAQPYTARYWY
eukprot:2252644-Prymnesium_polylepis.1